MPDEVVAYQQSVKNRFPWKLALPLYALSNGIILLFLRAYFWDDWSIYYAQSDREIKNSLELHGDLPTRGFVELNLLGNRPELFRLLTIVCFFLSGWCLFHILNTARFLNRQQVQLITQL